MVREVPASLFLHGLTNVSWKPRSSARGNFSFVVHPWHLVLRGRLPLSMEALLLPVWPCISGAVHCIKVSKRPLSEWVWNEVDEEDAVTPATLLQHGVTCYTVLCVFAQKFFCDKGDLIFLVFRTGALITFKTVVCLKSKWTALQHTQCDKIEVLQLWLVSTEFFLLWH